MLDFVTIYYMLYVTFSLAITVWVGRSLSKHGLPFLIENFEGNEALARSVNHLLLVGFYLVNVGCISLALRFLRRPDLPDAIELMSAKFGLVIVVLGVMHCFNMFTLMRFRRSSLFRALEPRHMQPGLCGHHPAPGAYPMPPPIPQPTLAVTQAMAIPA
jgi:hypothetical protein